jgi:hypothetical protein
MVMPSSSVTILLEMIERTEIAAQHAQDVSP